MHQNSISGDAGGENMGNLAGEAENGGLRLDFDARLRLEFRGAKVTTDAGLLAVRELDEVLGLTEMAGVMIRDKRTGRNIRHEMTGLLRQSIYARLAGYEDVNDQELLLRDPAMRAVVGRKAIERSAASTATVSRFETEILATEDNLEALAEINGTWVKKSDERHRREEGHPGHGFLGVTRTRKPGGLGIGRALLLTLLSFAVRLQPVW
jgi:hypothetical protein